MKVIIKYQPDSGWANSFSEPLFEFLAGRNRGSELRWLKTVHKYSLLEAGGPFLLSLAIISAVVLMGQVLREAKELVSVMRHLADLVLLFVYVLPSTGVYALPIASLLGTLMGLGRMSQDNEIVALTASGIKPSAIARPLLISGAIASVLTWFIADWAAPRGLREADFLAQQALLEAPVASLAPGVWHKLGEVRLKFEGRKGQVLENIVLIVPEEKSGKESLFSSKEGRFTFKNNPARVLLYMRQGEMLKSDTRSTFENYTQTFNFNLEESQQEKRATSPRQLTSRELLAASHGPLESPELAVRYRAEAAKRMALPLACLVFVLVGSALGLAFHQGSRAQSIGLCIAIILCYYVLLMLGETLAEHWPRIAFPAMFIPNVVVGGGGYWLLRKADGK